MKQIWPVKLPLSGVTTCRRFTLVELLVTIAVIAILASLLMPALNSARNKAQTIQCIGNLRNINTALISYADSSDGFVPGVTDDDNNPGGEGKKMGWSSLLLYEGHIRNGRELTCTGALSQDSYCIQFACSMNTEQAREFLESSGSVLWHMDYGGYGMNYFYREGVTCIHPANTRGCVFPESASHPGSWQLRIPVEMILAASPPAIAFWLRRPAAAVLPWVEPSTTGIGTWRT